MSRADPQFKLRMTDELKAKVETAATTNGRSMNAEIVSRLEASFGSEVETALMKRLLANWGQLILALDAEVKTSKANHFLTNAVISDVVSELKDQTPQMLMTLSEMQKSIVSVENHTDFIGSRLGHVKKMLEILTTEQSEIETTAQLVELSKEAGENLAKIRTFRTSSPSGEKEIEAAEKSS